ncbi:Cbb3-type cytochrome c oxidase subunit 3 [Sulfidibacter corallicola]|uniref:Cbb3-type cytochrome c oxidase subunit 3 n=1 Tax=Sulfidibacter corallicola TaxID=2818388 RepID=A0A8A4TWW6_SULCO|nr:cbb3-type cytochrome c oxidase subunit 3 [Sulfidibacter corallicola]QTD53688.1 cbb3-type cytochrome c oxidase subunit 3 [Sulfidibacter corallicola]
MLKQIISQGNFEFWPQLSLVMFLVTFAGILFWVYRKNSGKHYDDMANMILEDDGPETEANHGRG